MAISSGTGAFLLKCVGHIWKPPAAWLQASWLAYVSVSAYLLELLDIQVADDFRRYKDALLRETEAKSDAEVAKAQKLLAEAKEASNVATASKRRAELDRLEQEAKIDHTRAKTEAIRAETKNQEIVAAEEQLKRAISVLKQHGGHIIFDSDNLKKIQSSAAPEEASLPEIHVDAGVATASAHAVGASAIVGGGEAGKRKKKRHKRKKDKKE